MIGQQRPGTRDLWKRIKPRANEHAVLIVLLTWFNLLTGGSHTSSKTSKRNQLHDTYVFLFTSRMRSFLLVLKMNDVSSTCPFWRRNKQKVRLTHRSNFFTFILFIIRSAPLDALHFVKLTFHSKTCRIRLHLRMLLVIATT